MSNSKQEWETLYPIMLYGLDEKTRPDTTVFFEKNNSKDKMRIVFKGKATPEISFELKTDSMLEFATKLKELCEKTLKKEE